MGRAGEQFAQACIYPREPFARGSRMFWGGIAYDACTEYVLEVLEEYVVLFAPPIGTDFSLTHDHDRPHVALEVI
nr:unnamed protein product [Callosobruchus chinensis]